MVSGEPMTLERMVRSGQHWMLTPWRNIELVHASQSPLITPECQALGAGSAAATHSRMPQFTATCSIPSTDRIDLRAAWNEPIGRRREARRLQDRERIDRPSQ